MLCSSRPARVVRGKGAVFVARVMSGVQPVSAHHQRDRSGDAHANQNIYIQSNFFQRNPFLKRDCALSGRLSSFFNPISTQISLDSGTGFCFFNPISTQITMDKRYFAFKRDCFSCDFDAPLQNIRLSPCCSWIQTTTRQ
jgi:hypothetical protein